MEFRGTREGMFSEIRRNIEANLIKVGEFVSGDAKKLAPVDFGNLRNSISYEVFGTTVRITASAEYAAIQEFGGEISARLKPYLTFRTKDGKWHKVKKVYIPAQPYLRPAVAGNFGNISKILAG